MKLAATGPRFLEPHQAARIQDASSQRYRRAVAPFLEFLISFNFNPVEPAEFDDLIVEFKHHLQNKLTKSSFEGLIAGVEHVLPSLKGKLPWAHTVANSWSAVYSTEHTVPMCAGPADLIGPHMAADGHARLGAGLILQQALGLRP